MRNLITFPCLGDLLVGTLDSASGNTGLLIVSEGNEIRGGPHRSMALLAHRIAAAGYPVFRFDRRGVGDSGGENGGFLESGRDIAAAASAFRREAGLARVLAFGNGDAASALALFHGEARIDALLLANPSLAAPILPESAKEDDAGAARGWMRQIIGRLSVRRGDAEATIAPQLVEALAQSELPVTVLLATRDPVANAFIDALHKPAFAAISARVGHKQFNTASHVFAGTADKAWLYERMIEALAEQRAP